MTPFCEECHVPVPSILSEQDIILMAIQSIQFQQQDRPVVKHDSCNLLIWMWWMSWSGLVLWSKSHGGIVIVCPSLNTAVAFLLVRRTFLATCNVVAQSVEWIIICQDFDFRQEQRCFSWSESVHSLCDSPSLLDSGTAWDVFRVEGVKGSELGIIIITIIIMYLTPGYIVYVLLFFAKWKG